jgi:hypothetical protein
VSEAGSAICNLILRHVAPSVRQAEKLVEADIEVRRSAVPRWERKA